MEFILANWEFGRDVLEVDVYGVEMVALRTMTRAKVRNTSFECSIRTRLLRGFVGCLLQL